MNIDDIKDYADALQYVEDLGYIVLKPKTLIDCFKLQHFLNVLEQYNDEELKKLIPNKNETNNHKN